MIKFGYNTVKNILSAIYIYSGQSNIILTNSSIQILDDICQLYYILNSAGGSIAFINFNVTLNIYYDLTWYKLSGSNFSYENSG